MDFRQVYSASFAILWRTVADTRHSFDDEELCRRNKKVFSSNGDTSTRISSGRRRRSSLGTLAVARHEYAGSSETRTSLKDRTIVRGRHISFMLF